MTPSLSLATPRILAEIDRVEYAAITAKGAVIRSFSDRELAKDWLTKPDESGRARIEDYPGATIIERTHYAPAERVVWRERVLKVVAS